MCVRERELSLHADTSTEGPATGNGEILKNKSDSAKFQKDATNLKFPSGNQLIEGDSAIVSKSDAEKCAILQLSEENRQKLLLLASALENMEKNGY